MKHGFMIRRTKGTTLILSPFENPVTAGSWEPQEEVVWYGSTILTTKEKDDALFVMYKHIDRGVDRWIQDARYLPRLLLCALAFLITYFFFSLAVRDPLPMLDELLLAGGVAFALGAFLTSRDKKSDMAMKRRMELKQNASRSDFLVVEGLGSYEKYVDDAAYIDTIELADRLAMVSDHPLERLQVSEQQSGEWQAELDQLIRDHFKLTGRSTWLWYRKVMDARTLGKADVGLSARLLKLAMNQQIDLSLLALLVSISKQ